MSDDEIRIAVAECCGWHVVNTDSFKLLCTPTSGDTGMCCGKHLSDADVLKVGLKGAENGAFRIPDYPNHLNAMRDVITAQPIAVQKAMRAEVWRLSDQMTVLPPARVYAEALLRTLGRWKETKG